MLPTVFLSLSGADATFVSRVHEGLPDGLAYFYPKSFSNGEELVAAMENRVASSQLFVLFASKDALGSPWVGFELDRARMAAIKRREAKILVFPLSEDVKYSDYPNWIAEHWVHGAGYGPKDIARQIRAKIDDLLNGGEHRRRVFGRGALFDSISRQFQEIVYKHGRSPNVFIIAGNRGIGRRTVERRLLCGLFQSLADIMVGPVFALPQFADLADLYRSLRQEISYDFTLSGFKKDLELFLDLDVSDQVKEISLGIERFGKLGQAVTFVTGNGLFEDKGLAKTWTSLLIEELSRHE